MTAACHELHAFADGELPPSERPRFHHHLGDCDACQTELGELLLLDALLQPEDAAGFPFPFASPFRPSGPA
jgi:cellulose synthase operon protein C